ncbi:MAG: methenyltetrahydromethanopterin cyclohydrolase [Candidatus Bathyarchaeota archaeon]
MTEIKLDLKRAVRLPVYASNLSPDVFAGKGADEIKSLELLEGNTTFPLSTFFSVDVKDDIPNSTKETNLVINGDLSRFRYIGKGMTEGSIKVNGDVGFYLGQEMRGGSITVNGQGGSWVGSMMKDGQIEIFGNVGDYTAVSYRGTAKGMLGGTILIHGNAGSRLGKGMTNGLISVDGNVGLFAGLNMENGVIVIGGNCEGKVGYGMKGGRIIIKGNLSEIPVSFTFSNTKNKVKCAQEKISSSFYVYTGDILDGGNGKIFIARCRNRHLNPLNEVFPDPALNLNKLSLLSIEKLMQKNKELGVEISKHSSGATIIDAGVKAKGNMDAGVLVTLVCLGGLAEVSTKNGKYGALELPTLHETITGHPAVVTLGSQFAGWAIKTDDFYALGSGPARAISMQPKKIYEKICYREKAEIATLVIESDKLPTDRAIKYISKECEVAESKLYLVVASISSIVGSTQVAGRVVETGVHKLTEVGFNPNMIVSARGSCPIAPVHPKSTMAMGITNDMILYGGDIICDVKCKNDDEITNILDEVPSLSSRDYGKPFYETFKASGYDFYKIDPGLFAPAKITVNNLVTGNTFTSGKLSPEILKASLDLLEIND